MTDFLRRTWAQIDLDALRHNLAEIRALLREDCMLLGVVKADAYGHGDRWCAREMEECGVNWFGVSNLDEALSLREGGIKSPILIFGTTPPELAGQLAKYRVTQTVFSPEYALELQQSAKSLGVQVDVHIKIDTGMGRIGFDGFDPLCCADEVERVYGYESLRCEGIFTHFSAADDPASDGYTRAQFARFQAVCGELASRGITFKIRHCCNSAGTLRFPEMHLDMVRPGLILYGLLPDGCCAGKADLHPVMQLKTIVSMVKKVPAGRDISYGRIYTTGEETTIATVPIGYADGYHRALSSKGTMLVRGQEVPVIGRVCMDQLMHDVTGVDGVCAGDEVTVIGRDGACAVTVEQMALCAGSTFNYEIVCLIGKRVPRLYLREGKACGVAQYVKSAR